MAATWSWQLLRAGVFRLDGGAMFGVVPKALWSKMAEPDSENRIPLQTNCLLLDDGSRKVLIETGYGSKWGRKERDIFQLQDRTIDQALREAGTAPEDISHVIVSHLHFDHAGGLTHLGGDGQALSTFANAKIHVQHTEWLDALANKSTMTRTYLHSHLVPVEPQIRPVDGKREVLPGITAWPTPGHTWGHQAIRFDDGSGTVAFMGDVMPTVHHVGLAFNMAYDMLPHTNMLTKKAVLESASREGWRLVLDHEPNEPVIRVKPDPTRPKQFLLVPASNSTICRCS